jgi:RNase P/RNase MRP subunit p29
LSNIGILCVAGEQSARKLIYFVKAKYWQYNLYLCINLKTKPQLKKMKTILLAVGTLCLMAGCSSKVASSKGIVSDATMNTVTIVTDKNDTLSFSTIDANKDEVIAGSVGATYTTQGQVVAINGRSFLIQDNSGKILVYLGWKDNKPVVDYSATIGQTVKVTGKTTTYSKLVQFSETDLVIEKVSDGSFTQPTPEKFDGAAFDAYAAATPAGLTIRTEERSTDSGVRAII